MSGRDTPREPRDLPLSRLIAPELPARAQMDEHKLDDLVASVARLGIIQRLAVVVTGDRYEIVAGHRRFLAAQRAGLALVPCEVYATKGAALEAVKFAENHFREEMSAAEEAIYFDELLTRDYGGDIERLAAGIGKKVHYVDSRLQLLYGDRAIFDAVLSHQIKLGVADVLNTIPAEDYRRYYLRHAIKSGATIAVVEGWVTEWRNLYGDRVAAPPLTSPPIGPASASAYDPHRCYCCRKSDARFVPEQLAVHTHCRLAILDPLLESYHGAAAPAEP